MHNRLKKSKYTLANLVKEWDNIYINNKEIKVESYHLQIDREFPESYDLQKVMNSYNRRMKNKFDDSLVIYDLKTFQIIK